MSFKENVYQQLSITDSFSGLTAESKKLWKSHGQRSLRMSFSRQLMKKDLPFFTAARHPDRIHRPT